MIDRIEGTTLQDYHVLEKVGQGGMTSVYRALHLQRSEAVAVKVLSPYIAQDSQFKARFEREIEVLLKLRHKNIVPILDYGEANNYAFIVMPYMAEGTLQDRIKDRPLSPHEASRVMDEVTAALSFAHDEGVVHRDVKPSNILLDEKGTALLSDFGFAHVREVSLSLTGSALIGTPAYMSPEQCKGEKVDERSDQYSLGVVLYQICTGHLPFNGDTPMAIALQHVNEPLASPRRLNPSLPDTIENVLVRALSKDPDNRFDSIDDMNDAFQEALENAVDEHGNLVPSAGFGLSTWVLDRTPLGDSLDAVRKLWRRRRRALVGALLLLLALPTAGYALASLEEFIAPSATPRAALQGGENAALQATIDALSTEMAASGVNDDLIQAAVAGTLSAESRARSGRATPTPGLFESMAAQETAQAGLAFFRAEEAEASGDDESSSSLPSNPGVESEDDGEDDGGSTNAGPGPSATPTPTFTRTPTPTATLAPTNTQPAATSPPPTQPPPTNPPPTDEPRDVNPNACKSDPGHPNYCTPAP